MTEIVPNNSRYIPLTQQKSCCVPACISMVMLRNGIKLVSQELLGYELGLIVSKENRHLYWNPRTGEKPESGWGTQISIFPPEKAFEKLNIPIALNRISFWDFQDKKALKNYLREAERLDKDILICLNAGTLNKENFDAGHVVVFDKFDRDKIRVIDPSAIRPKWRLFGIDEIFNAMKNHPKSDSSGFWELEVKT